MEFRRRENKTTASKKGDQGEQRRERERELESLQKAGGRIEKRGKRGANENK